MKHVKIISFGGSRSLVERFLWPLHAATLKFLIKGVKNEENCSFSGFREGLRSTPTIKDPDPPICLHVLNVYDLY
jgi:hypothetical protein